MTTQDLLAATIRSIQALDPARINRMADALARVRAFGGRLFLLGNGGGHSHASHATCDFRKLCGIEAYCVGDNVSELTARVNDDGPETAAVNWLRGSQLQASDALLVVSVGGGSVEPPVSLNVVRAVEYAVAREADVLAIVGNARSRFGGYAGQQAYVTVLIPCDVPELVTPVTEGVQSVVLHALASHPLLQIQKAKWEGLA